MKIFRIFLLYGILWCLAFPGLAIAQPSAINNGIVYLYSAQSPDGSWLSNITTEYYATSEVLTALAHLGLKEVSYTSGLNWFTFQTPDNIDYLARRITLLNITDDMNVLLSYRNQNGVWGTYPDYVNGTIVDTTFAFQALKSINYSDQSVISSALGYLISTQNPDGGWGFNQGDQSNVYMTALVLSAFSQYKSTYNLQNPINNASAYLLTKQNPDGGFGSSSATLVMRTIFLSK